MRRDPTRRFTDRVAAYADARPRYPDALVELMVSDGLEAGAVIADIGSGTGLSAEPFLRHGYTVIGVEPDPAMRAAAEAWLGSYPGFRSVAGSAESTGLDDASVDRVVVAQAFHWFDVRAARAEADRILTPGGRACLVWNTRRTGGDAFLRGYEELLRRFGTDYEAVRHRTEGVKRDRGGGDALPAFFPGGHRRVVLENRQELDREGLEKRVRSSSYMPAEGAPGFEAMIQAVGELFESVSRDGRVRLRYDLEVFCGSPRLPTSDSRP